MIKILKKKTQNYFLSLENKLKLKHRNDVLGNYEKIAYTKHDVGSDVVGFLICLT